MTSQVDLTDRIRETLAGAPVTRETSMFGVRTFMVNEKMVAGAWKNGDLLVRVPVERHDELLERPGAMQAEMNAGRNMGRGWVTVLASMIADDAELEFWIAVALEHNRAVTGG